MNYKIKYLKYKNKYLNLVKQLGGSCSHPIFGKKTALELLKNKDCTLNILPFMFNNADEAKKLGFRYTILKNDIQLDKLVNVLKNMRLKPLVILNELNYFEDADINDWIRELYFSKEKYQEPWSDGTIYNYALNVKTPDLLKEAEDVNNYKKKDIVKKYFDKNKLIGFIPNIEKDKKFKELGYSINILINTLGFTIDQLKKIGYIAEDIQKDTSINWKTSGFSAADMYKLGISVEVLKRLDYSITELKQAGYNCGKANKYSKVETCW